jgi:hypothetical protein
MKYALISTIDVEKPYRFCEVSEFRFSVTEPALFWVECEANVTPQTHKYTDEGFVELPLLTDSEVIPLEPSLIEINS